MKNKKIYVVMYNFMPIGIGRGIAWHHFSQHLASSGYEVEVVTVEASKGDPYYNEDKLKMLNDINYKITRIKDAKFYYKVYPDIKKEKVNNNVIQKKSFLKSFAIKTYKKLTRFLFYPDRMKFWSKKVYKYLLNQNDISSSIVVSVGFPFSTHLYMNKLKNKKNNFLILDYGDPWSFNPSTDTEPKWRKKFDNIIEKKLLSNADYVTVTTNGTCEDYKNKFNVKKISVIRQGVDLSLYRKEYETNNENIKLVYTGIFYKDIRDPSVFFDTLKNVDSKINFGVDIIIAGTIDNYFLEYFNKIELNKLKNIKVSFLGNIGFEKCVQLQLTSDILLFFSNNGGVQVPGKVYEYLATDKPILSISYNQGETEKLIERYNRGVILYNSSENLADEIVNNLEYYKKNRKLKNINNNKIFDYDWNNISVQVSEIVERMNSFEKNNNN